MYQLVASINNLKKAKDKIYLHIETIKTFAGTGSKTIIRSFIELYLKQYEDKLWLNAIIAIWYGICLVVKQMEEIL